MIIWNDSHSKFDLSEISTCITSIISKNFWNFFNRIKSLPSLSIWHVCCLSIVCWFLHLLLLWKKKQTQFCSRIYKNYIASRDMVCCSTLLPLKYLDIWKIKHPNESSYQNSRQWQVIRKKNYVVAKGTFFNYSTFHHINST